jgi:hypothetical protein
MNFLQASTSDENQHTDTCARPRLLPPFFAVPIDQNMRAWALPRRLIEILGGHHHQKYLSACNLERLMENFDG